MSNFSENKKIAISAIAIFIVSLSVMLFFLSKGGGDLSQGQTNVLHSEEKDEGEASESEAIKAVFETSAEGTIIVSNRVFNKLIGAKDKELIGDKLFDYIKKEDLADFAADFAKIAQKDERKDGIGPYTLVNGSREKLVLFSIKPVSGKDGEIEKIVFFVKDLSRKIEKYKNKTLELEKTEESEEKSWYYKIYPKIKDAEEKDQKLLVDKITYKKP